MVIDNETFGHFRILKQMKNKKKVNDDLLKAKELLNKHGFTIIDLKNKKPNGKG
tara:strand:+ start:728 stop:889 length:162 start_codon:yes stop_codon:yes gene_type:complete